MVRCGCGSYWLGRCGVRRNLWLQVWYLIYSYVVGGIPTDLQNIIYD